MVPAVGNIKCLKNVLVYIFLYFLVKNAKAHKIRTILTVVIYSSRQSNEYLSVRDNYKYSLSLSVSR